MTTARPAAESGRTALRLTGRVLTLTSCLARLVRREERQTELGGVTLRSL